MNKGRYCALCALFSGLFLIILGCHPLLFSLLVSLIASLPLSSLSFPCFYIVAFLFYVILSAAVLSVVKGSVFVLSEESDFFESWECTLCNGEEESSLNFEVFYLLNMTNVNFSLSLLCFSLSGLTFAFLISLLQPQEVLDEGVIPVYNERGPFVYRANYTKFRIMFLEDDQVEYKMFK